MVGYYRTMDPTPVWCTDTCFRCPLGRPLRTIRHHDTSSCRAALRKHDRRWHWEEDRWTRRIWRLVAAVAVIVVFLGVIWARS